MKNIRQTILITLSILLVSSCSNLPIHQSKRVTEKPFANNLRYYNSKEKIMYDIYNDDKNIHVHISTYDYSTQVKILQLGFTLWLDQKGGRNKDKAVIFPLKQRGSKDFKRDVGKAKDHIISNLQDRQREQIAQLYKQHQLSPENMMLIGMNRKNSQEVVNPESEKSDIQVSISFDKSDKILYKAIIPINKIFTEEKYNDSIFSIGFESGFVEMSYAGISQERSGGRKGTGGGMRGGGRSGGGKGSGGRQGGGNGASNPGQNSALSEPVKTWFIVSLKPIEE